MMTIFGFFSESEEKTALLASLLAEELRPGDLLGLRGELGAGKTTFARALIRACADDISLEVPSPTFPLMQIYDTHAGSLCHVDLYRINHCRELDQLGLEEVFSEGIGVVEWPEKGEGRLPVETLRIEFRYEKKGRQLLLTFAPFQEKRFLKTQMSLKIHQTQ